MISKWGESTKQNSEEKEGKGGKRKGKQKIIKKWLPFFLIDVTSTFIFYPL